MLDLIKEKFEAGGQEPRQLSPLTLAFIGDSVYGMIIKTMVVLAGNCPANELDKKAVKYVKATTQAKIFDYLTENEVLTDEEADVLRRGRNAKSATTAKNASVGDYRKATGVEALVGYLYLCGRQERVVELMEKSVKAVDECR